MNYQELVAMVRNVATVLDSAEGNLSLNFHIRKLANETLVNLTEYITADETANFGAHSPRAITLFKAYKLIENATRVRNDGNEWEELRAARCILTAARELPSVADALDAMAPELLQQDPQGATPQATPTPAADPWALHCETQEAAGATHLDTAKAWKVTHPKETKTIEQLTKASDNYRSKRNRQRKAAGNPP